MLLTHKPIEYKIDNNGCWNCISHFCNEKTYPHIKQKGKIKTISRYNYEKKYGKIPNGLWVLHKCDNRKCINPEHLFLGTMQDNTKDMTQKGRAAKGEKNGSAKLTIEDIDEIRCSGSSNRMLGKSYGIAHIVISKIRRYMLWKHVTN